MCQPELDTVAFQKNLSFEIITAITCFEKTSYLFINLILIGREMAEKLSKLAGKKNSSGSQVRGREKNLKQTPEETSVRVGWLQTEGSLQPDWRLSQS